MPLLSYIPASLTSQHPCERNDKFCGILNRGTRMCLLEYNPHASGDHSTFDRRGGSRVRNTAEISLINYT
uniref:uncharacterized protein LOC117608025 isoform X2 n=1 Tax=Osmia lignaria TaxID=473952 RepID=UPI001478C693|nr:uncharacterized protein LOC117608025 isoform X2 [Osmia lignaria]